MRYIRAAVLALLMLLPVATLFHRDDTRHWDFQRSVMSAPDECSYMLMAQQFLNGGGLALKAQLGRDTFYPPGYPLLLAAWVSLFWHGTLTGFSAHCLNATLLSADILLVYFLSRRLISAARGRAADLLALIVTALFAANWHVLETALLVMSEPAFMLVSFTWLLVALVRPHWHRHAGPSATMALLATAAWSIRGAGIVCVAATAGYPLLVWLHARWRRQSRRLYLPAMAFALLLPAAYQVILLVASPEKSLAPGGNSDNSYTKQLLHGLDAGFPVMVCRHFLDYCASFVPWPRDETPDNYFRIAPGILLGVLAFVGFITQALRGPAGGPAREDKAPIAPKAAGTLEYGTSAIPARAAPGFFAAVPRLSDVYILLYFALYLIWPFDFARFWSPILPLMLVYAADAAIRFARHRPPLPRPAWAYALLVFSLVFSVEELTLELGNYARRLNYVSDALAQTSRVILAEAPDPKHTIIAVMGSEEHFALGWHLAEESHRAGRGSALAGGYTIQGNRPHDPARGGRPEHIDDMLVRTLNAAGPGTRVLFFSYFPEKDQDTRDTLSGLKEKRGNETGFKKLYEKYGVAVLWEFTNKPAASR